MKIPFKVGTRRENRKLADVAFGVLIVLGLVALSRIPGPLTRGMDGVNYNLFFDSYYHLRPVEPQINGPVVVVAAGQESIDKLDEQLKVDWPWPREFWGMIATYLADHGARVIAVDLLFTEHSHSQRITSDDKNFAAMINRIKIPVIFAAQRKSDGWVRFMPPIDHPRLAAANATDDKIAREYIPIRYDRESLALAAARAFGVNSDFATNPFLLHYYGPSDLDRRQQVFSYIPAESVLAASAPKKNSIAAPADFPEDFFRGKIVLLGATAAGAFDIKSSPISRQIPGVEVQATAMLNMLTHQRVITLPPGLWQTYLPLIFAIVVGYGVVYPRRVWVKLLFPAGSLILLMGSGILLFRNPQIYWLPPAHSLLALIYATPAAFSYAYLVEDRDRRFILSALKKMVSPDIADQLASDPDLLKSESKSTLITVVFTDLANFTKMSEAMDARQLTTHLNAYLSDLSNEVLGHNGTMDKFIGDAVMSFWNAPVAQPDHAILACRAALAMRKCREDLKISVGGEEIEVYTRIGINTTMAAVGFVGSTDFFDYTALGDGVNLGSRLEGANKIYGSRILISESTQRLVSPHFYLRRLDRLCVKGKLQCIDVFELLGDRTHPDLEIEKRIERYDQAFTAYQEKRWDDAYQILLENDKILQHDEPSTALRARIESYPNRQPPENWDGVYTAEGK